MISREIRVPLLRMEVKISHVPHSRYKTTGVLQRIVTAFDEPSQLAQFFRMHLPSTGLDVRVPFRGRFDYIDVRFIPDPQELGDIMVISTGAPSASLLYPLIPISLMESVREYGKSRFS